MLLLLRKHDLTVNNVSGFDSSLKCGTINASLRITDEAIPTSFLKLATTLDKT